MLQKLCEMLATVSGVTASEINVDTALSEDLGFDSIKLAWVLSTLSRKFGTQNMLSGTGQIRTVGDLLTHVQQKAQQANQ